MEPITPGGMAPPFSRYSHAMLVPSGWRWLHVSGQIGAAPDGRILEGGEVQLDQAWTNIETILAAAGMTVADIVKVGTFLTPGVPVGLAREVRDRHLKGLAPASTLLIVAGLASPELLIEVEVIAARPG